MFSVGLCRCYDKFHCQGHLFIVLNGFVRKWEKSGISGIVTHQDSPFLGAILDAELHSELSARFPMISSLLRGFGTSRAVRAIVI